MSNKKVKTDVPVEAPQQEEISSLELDYLAMLEEASKDDEYYIPDPANLELNYDAGSDKKSGLFKWYDHSAEAEEANQPEKRSKIRCLYLAKVMEVYGLKEVEDEKFDRISSTPFREYTKTPITVFLNGRKIGGGGCYNDIEELVTSHDAGVSHVYYFVDLDTKELCKLRVTGAPSGTSRKAAMLKASRYGYGNIPKSERLVQPKKGFIGNPLFELSTTTELVGKKRIKYYLMGTKLLPNTELTKEAMKLGAELMPLVREYIDDAIAVAPLVETAKPGVDVADGEPNFEQKLEPEPEENYEEEYDEEAPDF